jgi:coronin-7
MAWRFKASKYKNAAPIVPKPENYVRDICVGSYQTYGNNIAASAKFMAFNWDHAGSSLAVLPIDDSGRKSKLMPLLHAHSDTVTDMEFSPFHDGLLATGSQDCLVKIWHIPEHGLQESLSNPECTFSHKQRRVETVGFHPTADFLLHSTSYTTLTLWDLISGQEFFSNADPTDVIQSVSWKRDGTLLATSSKDKQVRILDPRVEESCVKTANSHQSIKDSRVVWLGDSNRVLTTGFDSQRLRQIIIRDLRNFGEAEKSLELDCSTGILIPLYDADTGMLFLAGKGDTTIGYMEVMEKEPYLMEGIRHSGEQSKGACLVPKRALNVMQGEVNRILQLTSTCVIPITYQVPRKTYRDFHADLYPDTPGYKTELTAEQWMNGKNIPIPRISLDPAKRENGEEPIIPRLGPKPFTPPKLNEPESFDKVFCVPAVPGQQVQQSNGVHEPKTPVSETSPAVEEICQEKEVVENNDDPKSESETVKSETVEENESSAVSGHAPKTPSTAERRKMFESNTKENEPEDNFDVIDQSGTFERASVQRSSIAERRKMYENRSQSVQETPTVIIEKAGGSPVMLRRKDSFKNRKNAEDVLKDDNSRKSGQVSKQLSLDHQAGKKGDNFAAPTPKRTSTVFGRVSKFRHLKGTPAHKSFHIENIRNLSRQISGECDGFHGNTRSKSIDEFFKTRCCSKSGPRGGPLERSRWKNRDF